MDKKVCVLGLGYIGLTTETLLANKSYDVHDVDFTVAHAFSEKYEVVGFDIAQVAY